MKNSLPSSPSDPFLILRAFARALIHQLRTPLSVISNEMYLLKSLAPPDEKFLSAERCREISDMLKSLFRIFGDPFQRKDIDCLPIFKQICAKLRVMTESATILISADYARLYFAFVEMMKLLQSEQAELRTENGQVSFKVFFRLTALSGNKISSTKLSSFTALFVEQLDLDTIIPPILDSIFTAHDGTIMFELDQPERVTITLPLVS